jgi:SOS response regulatory protein OraA/RecX
MAPRLSKSQHEQIRSIILQGFSNEEITEIIPYTPRAARRIRSTYTRFGTTTVPTSRTGPDPKITPTILDTLYHRLAKEPDLDRRKIASFIRDKFNKEVSVTTITRALQTHRITLKVIRRVAEQQKPELRHFYQYRLKMLGCRSYHLVFINESGIDKPSVFRRKG